jgi:methyl-accepting chemotaxis protein
VTIADRIAKGNLNNPPAPENNTEIGQLLRALNGMNKRLRELIGQISGTSQHVSGASQDILRNNSILSERAESEASTLQQTTASLEELTATVGQTADRSQLAQSLAKQAVHNVEDSSQVVRDVVTTMDDIQTSSRRIVDIIAVIDGIAFQTNILALNAAVEAARAGEQGAGFAVVAGEVRNLAQHCATAAKDIKGLIGTSVEKIGVGSNLVDKAGKAMDGTVASIRKVSDLLGEIAAASTEQRDGIAQINQAMLHLDQATQQSGTIVEQAAGIANMLSNHAQTLDGLVHQFDLGTQSKPARANVTKSSRTKISPPKSPAPINRRVSSATTPADDVDWQEF